MGSVESTEGPEYAARLESLQLVWWKRLLPVQAPYRWNLRRLHLGRTLEIGCGIGRNLVALAPGSVGVDHNADAVAHARGAGFDAVTSEEFAGREGTEHAFDSLLFAHVLEHMTSDEAIALVRAHLRYLRQGGKVVLITPQERGFASDASHVEFFDLTDLDAVARALGLAVERSYSFPFPRRFGRAFVYNECVTVAMLPHS